MTVVAAAPAAGICAESQTVAIGWLSQAVRRTLPLSYLDQPPADEGLLGARLGIADSNTTGQFTGQSFELVERVVAEDGDVAAAFRDLAAKGTRLVVTDLAAKDLLSVASLPEAAPATIFDAASPDDRLRGEDCRANVLHLLPSRAMLADALVQYLVAKRWLDLLLVVADEEDEFGDYLSYRTFDPRPVAGTQGLVPSAWARPHEQWGATQLQTRFLHQAKRWMTDRDYAAWMAVRAVGEAAARSRSTDPAKISAFLRSDQFELAAYKGARLSFRSWDGQLRQPILLADVRSLVSVSPQPGFLHQFSELDTLGIDKPETKCHMG